MWLTKSRAEAYYVSKRARTQNGQIENKNSQPVNIFPTYTVMVSPKPTTLLRAGGVDLLAYCDEQDFYAINRRRRPTNPHGIFPFSKTVGMIMYQFSMAPSPSAPRVVGVSLNGA